MSDTDALLIYVAFPAAIYCLVAWACRLLDSQADHRHEAAMRAALKRTQRLLPPPTRGFF